MVDEEIHYLYVLTNLSNNKQYVGVSKDPGSRYLEHMTLDTNPGIMRDRASCEFRMDILNKGSKKYIYQLEEAAINKLGSREPLGYNIALGGNGGDTGCATRGSSHCKAKVTEEQVVEIRNKRAAGSTYVKLAEEYGISKPTTRSICIGETWKHVEGPIEEPDSHQKAKKREAQARELLAQGFSCKQVSQKLDLKPSTVYYYNRRFKDDTLHG